MSGPDGARSGHGEGPAGGRPGHAGGPAAARSRHAGGPAAARSKSLATWLALTLGSLGAHRFYLHGWRDRWAWLHPLPTLLGLAGAIRMHNLGQDDRVAWLLIPVLGLMLSIGMLTAILIGLTPDEAWARRHHPDGQIRPSGWAPVLGAVLALLLGGGVLMGTLAFGGQMFFEYQRQADAPR